MKLELVAPAGNWTNLRAAVSAGADAVYFGVEDLNMRMNAKNFSLKELNKVVSFCHKNNVKTHLTLNSIVFDNELSRLEKIMNSSKKAGIDLIISWDMAVIKKALETDIPICLSTQASVSNSEAATFYKNLGVRRIVPARECSLKQIKEIKKSGVEVEAFVHGAMCVSVSGRCFMSHHLFGKSANRGECMQPCRFEYTVYAKEYDKEMILGKDYIMSAKDLCTIDFIDKLIAAGIDAFKIEGRKRSPEYVYVATQCYRKAIDLYYEDKLTLKAKEELLEKLSTVFNRGFSSGFFFEKPSSEGFSNGPENISSVRKVFIGKVVRFRGKEAVIKLDADYLKLGDNLLIYGPETGVVMKKIDEMKKAGILVEKASKSDIVAIKLKEDVHTDDLVCIIRPITQGIISSK